DEVQPLTPGEVYGVDVEIWPTCIVVPAGYRVALTIRGKDYEYEGELSEFARDFCMASKGVGLFRHDNALNQPPEIFDNRVTLHTGGGHDAYLLLPVIPWLREPERLTAADAGRLRLSVCAAIRAQCLQHSRAPRHSATRWPEVLFTVSFAGAIFDVDGVLVASPHERAWQEALNRLMATEWRDLAARIEYRPERFTTAVYQEVLAGKPRQSGARAALEYFGVPDAARRAGEYGERKQQLLLELIDAGEFAAFPDALRIVHALRARGVRLGVASSSKNANQLMALIRLDDDRAKEGLAQAAARAGMTLLEAFDANVCGRDFPRGKPDPAIFLAAAEELRLAPSSCFVVEDAPSGVQAAKAGGMAALGVARLGDEALLAEAGADLVVRTLDEVWLDGLAHHQLRRRAAATS
ncbi:MAG: HAD-IA family hydrolase, partial [Chloroflexi bacterium]|nr:HAD-IA family hydrolase [Chloroflexota bacterium]